VKIELRDGAPFLDGRPLDEGDELELRLLSDRWVPARYGADGTLRVALGGAWEASGEPPAEATLQLDLSLADLRWIVPAQQVTRLAALRDFVRDTAAAVAPAPDAPIELETVRAHREFRTQLAGMLVEYERQVHDRSFELLSAAARYGALHEAGAAREDPGVLRARDDLEGTAIRFESASRMLVALHLMSREADK
jgi:hypothetical protein